MKRRIRYDRILICLVLLLLILFGLFKTFKHLNVKENLMIDLTEYRIDEIEKYASANKLDLEIIKEYNVDVTVDKVIKQSIPKGTKLSDNQKLTVYISLGKVDVSVYKEKNVDELGRVPIMMYHGIHNLKDEDTGYTGGNIDKEGYQRTAESFRRDLEFYYKSGYRMIRLEDYVNSVVDVPLGFSPIVLTFDDGLKNNILVTSLDEYGNIIIDPNSAIGILEEFKQKYPDFGVTATFFLNAGLFNQPEYNTKILKWLTDNGYDIGNHSYSHADFTKVSNDDTQKEIGRMYQLLEKNIGDNFVNIVALPFGSPYGKTHDNFKYILKGTYDNTSYETIATLRVGWESNYSPFSKSFDKEFIKRIRAYDNNGQESDIEMNFKALEKNRYISDGDKNTIVTPKNNIDFINSEIKLKVITYDKEWLYENK